MARAILITYPGYPYTMSSLMPDNGLANLAGVLDAAGHEVRIVDFGTVSTVRRLFPASVAEALGGRGEAPDLHVLDRELEAHAAVEVARVSQELRDLVRSYRPDFVGFKLWNGDGCLGSIELARALRREFPGLKIIGGGPHVVFAIKPIIERTGRFEALDDGTFDALVQSEAEDLMPLLAEFATGRARLEDIPNTLYRRNGAIRIAPLARVERLDALAPPLYDPEVYPSLQGDEKLKVITLDESRGCPFTCSFCIQPLLTGRRLRLRSARSVVDEMERCVRRYRVSAFRFAGSATPGKLLAAIADEILRRGLQVRYTAFGRVNYSARAVFPRMRQSGLQSLFFGIESGSQAVLDRMSKQVRVPDMRGVLKASREAGIFTVGSLITPSPGETEETWQETIAFLDDVRPDAVLLSAPGPVPGTAWHTESSRFGIEFAEDFERRLLGFKFKSLLPPEQWDWPEYRVEGKSTRAMLAECGQKIRQVEAMGLLTMFSDDMLLMSRYCSLSPREFRDRTQRWLCAGDWQSVAALVAEINAAIGAEAAAIEGEA